MPFARGVRIAMCLWVVLAVVVWNAIFDRILIVSGRAYVYAAANAAAASRPYLLINDSMRPALKHALWTASAAGGVFLIVGCALIAIVGRRRGR